MKPLELHVYDFDGNLYDSPRLPVDRPDWWFSAKSLRGWGVPGQDRKWILPTLIEARRSIQAPWVRAVVLTGRPHHGEMQAVLKQMLSAAGLRFDKLQLKPFLPPKTTPAYKAHKVHEWLKKEPSITKVVFYDDLDENLLAVAEVARLMRVKYVPIKGAGIS